MKKNILSVGIVKGYLQYFENTVNNGIACNNCQILELTSIDTVCQIEYTDDFCILGQSASSYKGKPLWFAIRGFLPSIQFDLLKKDNTYIDKVIKEIKDKEGNITLIEVEQEKNIMEKYDNNKKSFSELKPKQKIKSLKKDVINLKKDINGNYESDILYDNIVISETIELRFLKERIPEYFLAEIGYTPTEFSAIVQSGYTNRAFKMKRIIFQCIGYIILSNIITGLSIILYFSRFLK